jgi:ribosome biogenesis GTPase
VSAATGTVVTRFGAELLVMDAAGLTRRCRARRRLEHVVCGDRVAVETGDKGCVVTDVLPRRNAVTRRDRQGRTRVIAANIDQMVVVTACRPAPNWGMVDRYLVAAENLPAEAAVVLNKIDLDCEDEAGKRLDLYGRIGYPALRASALTGRGLDALRARLRDRTSILVGASGVGKSALVKALLPDLDIRIGAISEAHGTGRHTTTRATLYTLPQGGRLIDSPGVRDFEPPAFGVRELQRGFREFAPYLGQCRFPDCTHTVEPGCAVIAAARDGVIDPRRLESYQRLALQALKRPRTRFS